MIARPGQTPESLAEEMLEQGKITQHDADEMCKFAEFLRVIGPAPSEENRPVKIPREWAEYVGLEITEEQKP